MEHVSNKPLRLGVVSSQRGSRTRHFGIVVADQVRESSKRFTKPNHPWTTGQVERMNPTIKEATVRRYHYVSHDELRRHLDDFMAAYNFARRLKTLRGLTPFEFINRQWTEEPERFKANPAHHMPGLNT